MPNSDETLHEAMTPKETQDSSKSAQLAKDQAAGQMQLEQILGGIVSLYMRSPSHQHMFISDLHWLVRPALALKQFRLFRNEGKIVGFVSWAKVSEDVHTRLSKGVVKLAPHEWSSGDKYWIVDMVLPPQKEALLLGKCLEDPALKDFDVHILRPKSDGQGLEVKVLGDFIRNQK